MPHMFNRDRGTRAKFGFLSSWQCKSIIHTSRKCQNHFGKALKPALRCHSSIKSTAAQRSVHCQALSLEDRWQRVACREATGKLKACRGGKHRHPQQSDIPCGIRLKRRGKFHWSAGVAFHPARGGIVLRRAAAHWCVIAHRKQVWL